MENSIKLYYQNFGDGLPVVLIHGYPLNHTIWLPVAERLASENFQIILPDMRGFGLSPAPGGTSTMDLMAGDVLNLLDELGIEKAVLVGHSMGGYVSMAFSRLYPGRLAGLGLVCTQASADSPEKRQERLNTARQVLKQGTQRISESMPARLAENGEIRDAVAEIIRRTTPEGIAGALRGMAERPDFTEWLASIKVPAVVIHGMLDKITPLENSELMSRLICRSWLVRIPDAHHLPMLENPESVAHAMIELAQKISQNKPCDR